MAESIYQFQIKWQQDFHEKCKVWAKTRDEFRKKFIIDHRHIEKAGLEKDLARLQIEDEIMASIIVNGKLDVARAENGSELNTSKLRLAIGGIVKGLEWTERKDKEVIKHTEDRAVYLILEERRKKNGAKIVTCYTVYEKADGDMLNDLPEITNEIWD